MAAVNAQVLRMPLDVSLTAVGEATAKARVFQQLGICHEQLFTCL